MDAAKHAEAKMADRSIDEIISLGTSWEPPPPDFYDPVIEAYKKDVDRTMLRENLRLTVAERMEQFQRAMEFFQELRAAGERMRAMGKKSASKPS